VRLPGRRAPGTRKDVFAPGHYEPVAEDMMGGAALDDDAGSTPQPKFVPGKKIATNRIETTRGDVEKENKLVADINRRLRATTAKTNPLFNLIKVAKSFGEEEDLSVLEALIKSIESKRPLTQQERKAYDVITNKYRNYLRNGR